MARMQCGSFGSLLFAVTLAAWPGGVWAQQPHLTWPRLEVRGAIAGHGAGDCGGGGTRAAAVGVDLRTHGRWIASAAVDVFLHRGAGCLDIELLALYKGKVVTVAGWPALGPRMSLSLGYALEVTGASVEVTAGLGTIPTRDFHSRRPADDWTWFDWQGGAVTVRFSSGPGIQFELGRHQLAERYYLEGQDVLVAEFRRWERMWRLGLSFPVAG